MSYQVDGVLADLDAAMRMLRKAVKGIPAETSGFKGGHDRLAKSVAALGLVLDDSRSVIKDENEHF